MFKAFDWMLFWNAFGAIGGTLGAMATSAAVLVALWQTKYSQKKKIKISFTDDIAIVSENGDNIYRFVGLEIINIGNREVIISGWGFILDNGEKMQIVEDFSPLGKLVSTKLPHKLQIEESKTLMYNKSLFTRVLNDSCTSGKLSKESRITFYMVDSTGKKYTTKTKKKVHELLACNENKSVKAE